MLKSYKNFKYSGIKNHKYIFTIILLTCAFFVMPISANAVGTTFSSEQNISNSNDESTIPQIAAQGDNVFLVWRDIDAINGDPETLFAKSSDNGANFASTINIASTLTAATLPIETTTPQIATSENFVYVVWQDETAANDSDIYLAVSSDSGDSFGAPSNISAGASFSGIAQDAKIAVNGTNVYIVWTDFSQDSSGDIYFRASTDSGSNFSPTLATNPTNLSVTAAVQSDDSQIIAYGDNVYVSWEEGDAGSENVAFRGSIDNGVNFVPDLGSSPTDLSAQRSDDGRAPSISISGNVIHSTFLDDSGFGRIAHRAITDNGDSTFSFAPALTSAATFLTDGTGIVQNPVIHSNGTEVYVAWEELQFGIGNQEIFFTNSTDGGMSFSLTTNQSVDSATSISPKIASSGDNVYLLWSDTVAAGADVKIRASFATDFADFGSVTEITNDVDTAQTPQMAAIGSNIYVVWDDNGNDPDSGTDSEVLFRAGTISSVDISFDQTEYKLSETSTITITAPNENTNNASADQFDVTITSDSSVSGITVTFVETGADTDSFTANITFNTSASSGSSLLVSTGDTLTAVFGGQTGTSAIFSRVVDFNGFTTFNLNSFASIRVVDQNSNIDTGIVEQIQVTVSSTNAPLGISNPITLTLEETGVDTGIFGTNIDNEFIFMNGYDGVNLDVQLTLRQIFDVASGSVDPGIIDTDTVTVNTPSAGNVGILVTETGLDTRILEEVIQFITSTTSGTSIQATAGDFFTITSSDGLTARGIFLPNTDSSRGALQVSLSDAVSSDTLTAAFGGETGSATVQFSGGEGGGGGGGVVRPGLVLNAVLGAVLFSGGGGADHSPPLSALDSITKAKFIDVPDHIRDIVENQKPNVPIEPLEGESFDLPLSINDKGYPLGSDENTIVTNQIDIGEPIKFQMVFYEQRDLEHVSIYMNLRDGKADDQSDTYILFEKREPIKIVDKNGFFEDVNVEIIEGEDNKKFAVFEIKFAKAMETSDLIYKSWDFDRRGVTVTVYDALKVSEVAPESEVVSESEVPKDTINEIANDKEPIPDWVKSNAKWWGEGQMDDKTFANGIGFLISEKIIDVPVEPNVSKAKKENDEILEVEEIVEAKVPDWVKGNAKWWGDDQIDEETFLSSIEYLVKHGIIIIS